MIKENPIKRFVTTATSLALLLSANTAFSTDSNSIFNIETSAGNIKVVLDKSPVTTTENFVHYAEEGFYNNTIFHRVIPGFMIQGGRFLANMQEKSPDAAPIKNEGPLCGKNTRGTLSMARTADPHSASTQFFINTVDNPFLDFSSETDQGWGYCGFGHVIEGMDVVDKIAAVATETNGYYQDVPVIPVVIKNVSSVKPG